MDRHSTTRMISPGVFGRIHLRTGSPARISPSSGVLPSGKLIVRSNAFGSL